LKEDDEELGMHFIGEKVFERLIENS